MERSRRWFDILATATLVVFAGFVAVHLFCAWKLPSFRKTEAQKLIDAGFQVSGESFDDPRFVADDSSLSFRRATHYAKGEQTKSTWVTERVPLNRPARPKAPGSNRIAAPLLRRILSVGGLADQPNAPVAQSSDGRDVAFVLATPDGIVLRPAEGGYRPLVGAALPPTLARLQAAAPRPLAERTASADVAEWADAVLETVTTSGPAPSLVVDRLIRVYREAPLKVDELVGLLILMKGADQPSQVARAITSIPDERIQKLILDEFASDSRQEGRRTLLAALAKREWGDKPSETLQDAGLAALENGDYDALADADRDAMQLKFKSYAGRADAVLLSRVVMGQDGPAAGAAYTALRKVAGEPLGQPFQAAQLAEARAWVDDFRKTHPDWFP